MDSPIVRSLPVIGCILQVPESRRKLARPSWVSYLGTRLQSFYAASRCTTQDLKRPTDPDLLVGGHIGPIALLLHGVVEIKQWPASPPSVLMSMSWNFFAARTISVIVSTMRSAATLPDDFLAGQPHRAALLPDA